MKFTCIYRTINRVMGKYLFFLGILILLMSCGKDIDMFIPRAGHAPAGDISRLTERLASDLAGDIHSVISCPCSGDRAFKVDKDLVLVIPPDFVDLTIYPCTEGTFDLHVTVCDTKGDILISGLPTISEGKLLESRIEINLEIRDGVKPIRLRHGKQIRILVNDPDPRERMELFYGDPVQRDWIQADQNPYTWDNVFNSEWWIQQDSGQSIISGFGYESFSDSLDWINVDVFFQIPEDQLTTVCLNLPEEFTNTNTAVFMVFDNYRSVLELKGDGTTQQFCEPYGAAPTGYRVTFVVIAEMGEDQYYFTTLKTTLTSNHTESLEPRKTPYTEIQHYLRSL